jgi:endogenous inhibitor of DNA gyrase (YacG/DUF329 family)
MDYIFQLEKHPCAHCGTSTKRVATTLELPACSASCQVYLENREEHKEFIPERG